MLNPIARAASTQQTPGGKGRAVIAANAFGQTVSAEQKLKARPHMGAVVGRQTTIQQITTEPVADGERLETSASSAIKRAFRAPHLIGIAHILKIFAQHFYGVVAPVLGLH